MARAGDVAEKPESVRVNGAGDVDLLPLALNQQRLGGRDAEPAARRWIRLGNLVGRISKYVRSCIAQEIAFGHLFYWMPVLMGLGAVFWFSAASTPSTAYLAIVFGLSAVAALRLRYERPMPAALSAALALLCCGALLADWETRRAGTIILDSPVTTTLTGIVSGREAVAGGRWRYVVEVVDTERPRLKRMPRKVTLSAPGGDAPIALGAAIKGRARLLPPSGPALAGLNDFAFDAYFAGNGAIGFFYGTPDEISATPDRPRSLYQDLRLNLEDLRGRISARIRSVLPGDTGAFAASMVTDDRRAISKETTEALRLAGLSHIVAISGLNMALAAGIFFVGIRALLGLSQELAHRFAIKKIAAAGALLTVSGYYLISGFAVSAERAYLMMAIMLMAAMVGRPAISLRNVALSAIIILVLSPSAIMGPGFQMSYAATLALVAGYSVWQRRGDGGFGAVLPRRLAALSFAWTFAGGVFVTSLIGGVSTMLFSIEHFHRIAVWGLPANLLAMPIISLIVMPAGLAALILMPIGLDWLALKAMGVGLDLVIVIAKWAASLGGDVVTGRIHAWLFVGLSLCLVTAAIMRSRLRLAAIIAGALLLCANAVVTAVERPDLVIHEEGRLAALVQGDHIATTELRPTGFIFEQWQRALPAQQHVKPVTAPAVVAMRPRKSLTREERRKVLKVLEDDLGTMPSDRFLCRDEHWCVARARNGARIIVMTLRDLVGPACDKADLVITSARLLWTECQSGAKLLSAETFRRSGTVEIWFNPENIRNFRVVTGLGGGDRPWYIHRTYDWRRDEYLKADSPPRD